MTDKEFKAEIKNGLEGGYIIYGEEEYLKRHLVDTAVKSVVGDDDFSEINVVRTDADSYSAASLEDAIANVPMMAEKCAALCEVRLTELKESEKEAMYAALRTLENNPQCVLLLVVPTGYFEDANAKRGKVPAVPKKLESLLKPVYVPYQPLPVLRSWVERHFRAEGLAVGQDTLNYFVSLSGPDMTSLVNEIDKVSCYVKAKERTEVTANDVAAVCSDNTELDAFALSNAVVNGDREGALEALKECRDNKVKPTTVIARMTSEFMNMLSVAACVRAGMYKQEISKKLGLHEFRVGKYMESVRESDLESVRAVLARCVDVEAALKSTATGYEPLEKFVCTIPSRKAARGYR